MRICDANDAGVLQQFVLQLRTTVVRTPKKQVRSHFCSKQNHDTKSALVSSKVVRFGNVALIGVTKKRYLARECDNSVNKT